MLISVAPIALLVLFYLWLLKGQSGLLGVGGGTKFQPVDPEKVRVTFKDVAGIDEVEAEISEVVDEQEIYEAAGIERSPTTSGAELAGHRLNP